MSSVLKMTIAICTWNRSARLDKTLTQLRRLDIPASVEWEVLVVDNNSSDQTRDVLCKHLDLLPLRTVFEPRQGKSIALNTALDTIDSDWVLWTDDDILVESDWLACYVQAIEDHPAARFFGGSTIASFVAPIPAWLVDAWADLGTVYGERILPDIATPIDHATLPWGGNFCVRTDVNKTHRYNTRLGRNGKSRLAGEEEELVTRLLHAGLTGFFVPGTTVRHVIPPSLVKRRFVRTFFAGHGRTRRLESLREPTVSEDVATVFDMLRKQLFFLLNRLRRPERRVMFRFTDACISRGEVIQLIHERLETVRRTIAGISVRASSFVSSDPPLVLAARTGDREAIGNLLDSGVSIDACNSAGQTALHRAVRCHRFNVAAQLLHAGADWSIPDKQGQLPLSLRYTDRETLHAIRQHYRRMKSAPTRTCESDLNSIVRELEARGIVKIGGMVDTAELLQFQTECDDFVARLDLRLASGAGAMERYDEEEHWWPDDLAYVSNNAFKHLPVLANWHGLGKASVLAEAYYGKRTYITRASAMRYLPCEARSNDMFGWHHDMEDKRLKVMILLTDVQASDQHMSYVTGSHTLFHPYRMFQNNTCTLDYCRKRLGETDMVHTIGSAGDVFLFDSNGVHRGVRRPDAEIRDVAFIEYSPDTSDVWGGDIDASALEKIDMDEKHPLWVLHRSPKKWESDSLRADGYTTWMLNLESPQRWLQC